MKNAATLIAVFALLVSTSLVTRPSTAAVAARTAAPQRDGDTSTGDLPPDQQAVADEQSEETIRAVCVSCHPVANIVRTRRVPSEWNTVVARMATLGARATDDQFRMIRRYMIRYYGAVQVNSAPADEFSAVLGYSPKDATAIVAYRQAHGRFADIDALAKVPGLDRSKLDEQPEALKFD
jgi:competence ComEA-like helix-hairpin-helix protein